MSGISPDRIMHPYCLLVKQKRRTFNQERKEAIQVEVEKLLKVGFIREVLYPDLISNMVLFRKSNRQWWICVDFTDLNRACPNIAFHFPA